jgi:hypothetical protein
MKEYKWLIIGTFVVVGVSTILLVRSKKKIKTDIAESDYNFQQLGLGNTKK